MNIQEKSQIQVLIKTNYDQTLHKFIIELKYFSLYINKHDIHRNQMSFFT